MNDVEKERNILAAVQLRARRRWESFIDFPLFLLSVNLPWTGVAILVGDQGYKQTRPGISWPGIPGSK